MRDLYRQCADIIRMTIADEECDSAQREKVAVFARKAADTLRATDRAFRDEWFFGACGLDNWGELMDGAESGQ